MTFRIDLHRKGEEPKNLGTAPTVDAIEKWFNGAYSLGLLPDPPLYTDEIRVFEINKLAEDWEVPELRWVWRLSWHQFDAKPSLIKVVQ